jgi:hypothetical protein
MIEHFQSFGTWTNFFKRFFSNAIGKSFYLKEVAEKLNESRIAGNFTDVFYQSGRITRMLFDIDPEMSISNAQKVQLEDHDEDDQFELLLHFFSAFVNATSVLDDEQ